MRATPLITLFLTVPLATVNAQLVWGPTVEVAEAQFDHQRPRITLVQDTLPLILWGSTTPTRLHALAGTAIGTQPPVVVTPPDLDPWTTYWAGADVAGHGDTVVAVFSTGAQGVGPLYATRSVDGGDTWGDTVVIGPGPGLEARFPTVAYVVGSGPVVEFMEFDPNWSAPRYVTVRSLDGGLSFSPPVPVSAPFAPGEVCDCCTGHTVAEGARVAALFRNNDNNVRTIWGAASNDGGGTYATGAQIDGTNWMFPACASSGPDAILTGDSLRYVWMSGATNGYKVHLASAHFPTLAVGATRLVHAGLPQSVEQNFPRIAGSGDTLGVVWQQKDGNQYNVLFSYSTSGPGGLGLPDTVSTLAAGKQRTPDIAFSQGRFHIVWEDRDAGTVAYRSATLGNANLVAEQAREAFRVHPVPARDRIWITPPLSRPATFEVLDATGRTLRRHTLESGENTLPVGDLPNGTYLLVRSDRPVPATVRFQVLH